MTTQDKATVLKANYQHVVDLMQHYDPNGEYDADEIMTNAWPYLDILNGWAYEYQHIGQRVPSWLFMCIRWLDAVTK